MYTSLNIRFNGTKCTKYRKKVLGKLVFQIQEPEWLAWSSHYWPGPGLMRLKVMQRLSNIICLAFSEVKKELEVPLEDLSKLDHFLAESARFLCLLQTGRKIVVRAILFMTENPSRHCSQVKITGTMGIELVPTTCLVSVFPTRPLRFVV